MNSQQLAANQIPKPTLVYDPTLLKKDGVYQIEGCLYRFLRVDPFSNINAPKYEFSPLGGQKRKKDLSLNRNQLLIKVYEIRGMTASKTDEVKKDSVQLGLF